MTDDEIKKFDELIMGIVKHKNRKLIQLDPEDDAVVMIIPMADVLAQFRGFTNYIKTKQKKAQ